MKKRLIIGGRWEGPFGEIDLPDEVLDLLTENVTYTMSASYTVVPPGTRAGKREVVSVHIWPQSALELSAEAETVEKLKQMFKRVDL